MVSSINNNNKGHIENKKPFLPHTHTLFLAHMGAYSGGGEYIIYGITVNVLNECHLPACMHWIISPPPLTPLPCGQVTVW